MRWEKKIDRYAVPNRLTFRDCIFYFGSELKEAGFDLDQEFQYHVTHSVDYMDEVLIRCFQHDRFRVRAANEFYPFAII